MQHVRFFAALLLALVATGCALDTSGDDDEVDAVADDGEALTDEGKGVSGGKLCVRAKSATGLHVTSGGPSLVEGVTLEKGRWMLVQRKPGLVQGRVWADPDLFGLRGAADYKNLAKRCDMRTKSGKLNLAEARRANEAAKIGRRGWVDVDDVTGDLRKILTADQPDGPPLQPKDRVNGKPKTNKPMTIKSACTVDGAYRGSSATNPAGFATYGTNGTTEIYVSYGTTDIDGGGVSFGYIPTGHQVFWLEDDAQAQRGAHCQVDLTEKVCNGDAAPGKKAPEMTWSAVWTKLGSRTIHGWVPKDCLE